MPWDADDLATIGGAEELQVSSVRPDGTDRPFVTIWGVRAGDDLYIRSAYGPDNPWYRRARRAGIGRIRADVVDRPVSFTAVDAGDEATQQAVDAAYHAKYDRFGPQIVGTVTGPASYETTLRLDPR
ncbi:DUF2255 family protein [Microbacterium sp. zg.Y625]|uniref:DUF2255 family protein n=1 Tax=Microbacterium jiangjiandongii TaxID=3049071 RepID=UPI00214CE46A|nr:MULTISPECIES: DUF2255 family protein [unclassified Microbacterium]MCR2793185.1 DUF2255 family protein [Microbacterium sp. zg.Y625]WIM25435.1 DUF2255 family protein [Microbacterium sp. zg-Y625]